MSGRQLRIVKEIASKPNGAQEMKKPLTSFLAVVLLLVHTVKGVAGPQNGPAPHSPNILFILTDDLGWRDLSCYGSDLYETPNIDRLASQGMRFTDAYAAATVCSPTRAAVLTGKTPARLHLTDVLSGLVFPHAALKPPDWQRHFLPHEEVTLAEMLKQAGYETFYFGKWHLGGEEHFPATQGFDHSLAETQAGWPGTYFYPWPMVRNLTGKQGDYLTDRLTDEVIKSLQRPHDQPFFTFLSYFTPHRPTQAKEEHIRRYKEKLTPKHVQRNLVNAGMIHSLDENVGRIMRSLDDLKLADNTLLIFASDNGGNHYADTPQKTNNAPLRDVKGSAHEGAYRVPLIVRWPGKVAAGSETTEPVSSVDFFPTLQAVSGQEPSTDEDLDLRRSLFNLFPLAHVLALSDESHLGRQEVWLHPQCLPVGNGGLIHATQLAQGRP
jgi:arylsulfatase A